MIADFFILCSGARKEILNECPSERTKFAGIGSVIFLTAVLAVISGGYAIWFTFNDLKTALLFGLLWGFVIFCIDRYIVSSIKKTGNIKKELLTAAPRFLIGFVLAISISKPLEIKLFDGTIMKQLGAEEEKSNKDCENSFNAQRNALDKSALDLRIEMESKRNSLYNNDPVYKDVAQRKKNAEDKITELNGQIQANMPVIAANTFSEDILIPGTDQTRKIWRYNQIARGKAEENKRLRIEMADNRSAMGDLAGSINDRKADLTTQVRKVEQDYTSQIAGVQSHIADLDAQRQSYIAKCKSDATLDKDILGRLRALGQLKTTGNPVWWASLLITALFLLIETAPVTVKLLAKRGPYDEILDRIEKVVFLEQKRIIYEKANELEKFASEIDELSRLKVSMQIKSQSDRIQADMKANEALLEDISQKVSALAKIETEKWYNEQFEKLAGKPGKTTTAPTNGVDHAG